MYRKQQITLCNSKGHSISLFKGQGKDIIVFSDTNVIVCRNDNDNYTYKLLGQIKLTNDERKNSLIILLRQLQTGKHSLSNANLPFGAVFLVCICDYPSGNSKFIQIFLSYNKDFSDKMLITDSKQGIIPQPIYAFGAKAKLIALLFFG